MPNFRVRYRVSCEPSEFYKQTFKDATQRFSSHIDVRADDMESAREVAKPFIAQKHKLVKPPDDNPNTYSVEKISDTSEVVNAAPAVVDASPKNGSGKKK